MIKKGDIGLEYCHTDNMVANFMTKPLQGKKFLGFRDCIMGMTPKPETEIMLRDEK